MSLTVQESTPTLNSAIRSIPGTQVHLPYIPWGRVFWCDSISYPGYWPSLVTTGLLGHHFGEQTDLCVLLLMQLVLFSMSV